MTRSDFLLQWETLYADLVGRWKPAYYGDLPIPPPDDDAGGWIVFWGGVEKSFQEVKYDG